MEEDFPRDVATPAIGDNVLKAAQLTLVCKWCYVQVEIVGFYKNGLPKYKCPTCNKERRVTSKIPTAVWMEYKRVIEYRKANVL